MANEKCTAIMDDPKTRQNWRCGNPAVVRVTDLGTGSREFYCLDHNKLYDEFREICEHHAARWRAVPQFANADA